MRVVWAALKEIELDLTQVATSNDGLCEPGGTENKLQVEISDLFSVYYSYYFTLIDD